MLAPCCYPVILVSTDSFAHFTLCSFVSLFIKFSWWQFFMAQIWNWGLCKEGIPRRLGGRLMSQVSQKAVFLLEWLINWSQWRLAAVWLWALVAVDNSASFGSRTAALQWAATPCMSMRLMTSEFFSVSVVSSCEETVSLRVDRWPVLKERLCPEMTGAMTLKDWNNWPPFVT